MASVLVVDDQEPARVLLGEELAHAGFDVASACDGDQAWESFCTGSPDVVITDLKMPGCDGIELLRRIRQRSDVPVIVFSGHGSIEASALAFKTGADDFVSSLDLGIDDLVSLVREAASGPGERSTSGGVAGSPSNVRATNARAAQNDASDELGDELAERLAGTSRAATRIRWQVAGLAPLAAPVLVTGEIGTGRATTITALHELGSTCDAELTRVECAGVSAADLQDELDDAVALHLEDIEHLAWGAQSKLASRLGEASPTGEANPRTGTGERPRIFASTSAPLQTLVRSGGFHPDLGRILMRFHIELPALRDRSEDIGLIAQALLRRIGPAVGRGRIQLSAASLAHLETARFPENIRQLERLLERAAAYSLGRVIRRQTLQDLMVDLEESIASMRNERLLLEREHLLRTLQETGGNITRTADILGKSRAAIYRLIEKHSIPLTRSG